MNNFLLRLSAGTYSRSYTDDLDLDQKVKEILTQLEPSRPDNRSWWHSTPSAALLQPDAPLVALELYEESLSWFADITFLDYVREALYPDEDVQSLEAFEDWHDDLFNQISDRLEKFPGETEKFVQVIQVSAACQPNTIPRFNDFNGSDCPKEARCIGRSAKVCRLQCLIVRTWSLRLNPVLK